MLSGLIARGAVGFRTKRIVDALTDEPVPVDRSAEFKAQLQRVEAAYQRRCTELADDNARKNRDDLRNFALVIAQLSGLTDEQLSAFTWTTDADNSVVALKGPFKLRVENTVWSVWLNETWVGGGAGKHTADAHDRAVGWIRYLHGYPVNFKPEL